MSTSDSTPATPADKPQKREKPRPDFPLIPRAAGEWAKKIRGKLHYFGLWDDPDGAEERYEAEKDALYAGKKPRQSADGYTLKILCNDFLFA